jgi:ATP-dependent Clp protease ATP-binding subunit ClpC
MRLSREVQDILREARDMAEGASQPLTTGHLLLGMLTQTNRAAAVLTDLRVDAERIVAALGAVKRSERKLEESEALLTQIEERMTEAARRSDALLVSSLHLLLALTREKTSIAYRVFSFMGIPPVQVRTLALGRITGPTPRGMLKAQATQADRAFADEPAAAVAVATPETPESSPKTSEIAPEAEARAAESAAAPETPEAGSEYALDPEEFPLLTGLGRNLTAMAAAGRIDPVIGREAIIDAMIDILNKRRSNNPCLVGEPGVGKTAIVEGLALAMLENAERVHALRNRMLVEIDVGSLVAGTELRGSFSRRMAKLKDEVKRAAGRVIVFIDEIHTLVGAGSGEGALDAANDLKAALARGEFPCIGATTPKEYHRYIERDPALERRFQPLEVPEPSEAESLAIVRGVVAHYEAHHGVIYQPDALEAAVRMSRRYLVDRRLPDKAFSLIDIAAARAVRHGKETVERLDVAEAVSAATQIPVARLMLSDAERLLTLGDFMLARVIGQPETVELIHEVILRQSVGFASERPIGSFLFLGPTGAGKTHTAKVLADFLFCSPDAMTRIDMSELMEKHAVSRLLGAAPGYVGHEEAGELTQALARRPYQIVLFDEIEKAHPDVLNLLLQVLDEGRLTDAKGRTLSFSSTVIILTSNLGAEVVYEAERRVGFGPKSAEDRSEKQKERVLEAARKALLPELWGRIDEKCVFRPLGPDELRAVARLLIQESSAQLEREKGVTYRATEGFLAHLVEVGHEPGRGARPMRRAVQRLCETALAQVLVKQPARAGDHFVLDVSEGRTLVTRVGAEAALG